MFSTLGLNKVKYFSRLTMVISFFTHTLLFNRSDCFSTGFFTGCLDALLEKKDKFATMIKILGRK